MTMLCLSRVKSLKGEWWHFWPSSLWFQGEQLLPRNLTGKGSPSKEQESFSLDKQFKLIFAGEERIYKEATKGIKEASEKAAKNLAYGLEALAF